MHNAGVPEARGDDHGEPAAPIVFDTMLGVKQNPAEQQGYPDISRDKAVKLNELASRSIVMVKPLR